MHAAESRDSFHEDEKRDGGGGTAPAAAFLARKRLGEASRPYPRCCGLIMNTRLAVIINRRGVASDEQTPKRFSAPEAARLDY